MIKPKAVIFIAFATMFSFSAVDAFALFNATKFTVVVENEEGKPLSGINVGVGFEKNTGWGTNSSGQQGVTDDDGRLTFSGQSNGHITYGGSKDGYYPSYYDYDFKDLGTFGWEPWNPELKIVMRKIENPVPMYARYAGMEREIKVPVLNEDIGFDLIEGDWVAPYGKGKVSDFVFNLEKIYVNGKSFSSKLALKFSNINDGIVNVKDDFANGSTFKLPRYAFDEGYESSINFSLSRRGGRIDKNYRHNIDAYIFRVRSTFGEKDKQEIKGLYGKLRGAVEVSGISDEKPIITFKYYLNPDGTRNLEFDPNNNLFGNLPMLEQVQEP